MLISDWSSDVCSSDLGKLSEELGQEIIVENMGGGGGSLASATVIKAEPDGYTLLYHSTTGPAQAAVRDDLPYDWFEDLVPVSQVRSEEHTSEIQSLMRNSYTVFC